MNAQDRFAPQFLDAIRQRVRIVDLIGRRVKLKRNGHAAMGLCPFHKERGPSFRVDNQRRTFHCFGCGAHGDVFTWLMQVEGLTFPEAVHQLAGDDTQNRNSSTIPSPGIDRQTAPEDVAKEQIAKARWLWRRGQPAAGSPAETYLKARGFSGRIPATIRFLSPSRPDHHPAMMTAYGVPAEIEPGILAAPTDVQGVHLTLLRADGSAKVGTEGDKIMVGACRGSPLVLAPVNDLLGLVISEGIEDGLSVHAATGLGAWAAGSASLMHSLADVVPDFVDTVSIAGHADPAGVKGAHKLAAGLRHRGIETRVLMIDQQAVA